MKYKGNPGAQVKVKLNKSVLSGDNVKGYTIELLRVFCRPDQDEIIQHHSVFLFYRN